MQGLRLGEASQRVLLRPAVAASNGIGGLDMAQGLRAFAGDQAGQAGEVVMVSDVDLARGIEALFHLGKGCATASEFTAVQPRVGLQRAEQEIPHAHAVLARQPAAVLGGCAASALRPRLHRYMDLSAQSKVSASGVSAVPGGGSTAFIRRPSSTLRPNADRVMNLQVAAEQDALTVVGTRFDQQQQAVRPLVNRRILRTTKEQRAEQAGGESARRVDRRERRRLCAGFRPRRANDRAG
jgi:hypothetical protein